MQDSRLFRILYYLLEKGKATAPELAEQFEVSVRTILRDIDSLSAAGIPIYTVQGKGGGISLSGQYVLEKALFSAQEQQQIILALQSMSAAGQGGGSELLRKISTLFQQDRQDWIQVDFSRWGNSQVDQDQFELLKNAIWNRQLITFDYVSAYGENSTRRVKPIRLLYKSHAWYLQGWCMEKQDYRTFKINRIDSLCMLEECFSELLSPPPFEPEKREGYPLVRLRFRAETAYRVYDEFSRDCIQIQENGDLIVSRPMPVDAWLYGYLLSFCGEVEVLEPAELRDSLAESSKKAARSYESASRLE